ncbi:MAG: hypothetical protein ACI86M_000481 [Saprospiraceae bacterium]
MFLDKEGNVWLSTIDDGLLKVVFRDHEVLSATTLGEDLRDVKRAGESILSFSFSNLNIYSNNLDLIVSIPFEFQQDKHLIAFDNEIYVFETRMIRKFDIWWEEKIRTEYSLRKKSVTAIGRNIYI